MIYVVAEHANEPAVKHMSQLIPLHCVVHSELMAIQICNSERFDWVVNSMNRLLYIHLCAISF